ncbi:VOC family protein [Vibrio amylolyticus]|uniref:VOC family protein n=1 Tax=Vibrio amylolyticus TaxID=2847292 RepID=UPI00354CB372
MQPVAVLIHVPDVQQSLEWYKKAFPTAIATQLEAFDFVSLSLQGFAIEIVQADDKVTFGKQGTVVYWSVDNIEQALTHFYSLGCTLYRGPMDIENSLTMCQVEDPFGNLIGLRGQHVRAQSL